MTAASHLGPIPELSPIHLPRVPEGAQAGVTTGMPEGMRLLADLPPAVQATSSGVKLIGETVLPGASLIAEGRWGQGVLLAALGILGGAAGGALLGPLGYLAVRFGASAVSYRESLATSASRATSHVSDATHAIHMLAQNQVEIRDYVANVADRLAAHQQETANQLRDYLQRLRDAVITRRPMPAHPKAGVQAGLFRGCASGLGAQHRVQRSYLTRARRVTLGCRTPRQFRRSML
jgi:hypothetical protein